MTIDSTDFSSGPMMPGNIEDRLMGWLLRLAGAVLMIACAAGWVTLLSWSASDPSLSHATGVSVRNWLGPIGAILSDLALQTFGLTAVFAYLAPFLWGWQLVRCEQVSSLKFKLLLFPLSMLALAGALSALPILRNWPLNHGYGGIIGDLMLSLAVSLLSMVNPQRAAMAAGVLFLVGGFAALFAALGLTHKELKMLWQTEDNRSLRAGITAGFGNGYATTRSALSNAVAQVGDRASRAGIFATIGALLSGKGLRGRCEFAGDGPDPGFIPAAAEFSGGDWADNQPVRDPAGQSQTRVDIAGELRQDDQHNLNFGLSHKAVAPDCPLAGAAGAEEDPCFTEFTERDSLAIAQRFAPEGAARKVAARQHIAASQKVSTGQATGGAAGNHALPTPSQQREASGFLKGLRAKRPQPVGYRRPSLNMLKRATHGRSGPEFNQTVLRGNARLLEDTLNDFGIKGQIKGIKPGPVVTLFELEPARGTKSSRVIALADDIARDMSATSVRVSVVPGRNVLGIELPNIRRETVLLRELLEADAYRTTEAMLPVALGKSISGEPIVADLAQMPHLLVAGTTGSGKSVGVNAMILSLLYAKTPEECRFIMIDPKMLELSVYNGIPHLLTPVVTEPERAVNALAWVVGEMEERYKRMSKLGVRNIKVFNNRVRNAAKRGEVLARRVHTGFDRRSGEAIYESEEFDLKPMPHIVVVVDEFADLMAVARKEIEAHVQRLAQMARAAGIHLIMATQRPSVDVITGTIKANFPTRISFKVTSKIDSRTILNEQGAEQLLGHGDMLFSGGMGQLSRVHGPLVLDEEVEQIASFLREQSAPDYIEGIAEAAPEEPKVGQRGQKPGACSAEELFDRAVAIVIRDQRATTSYLQRQLSIGYNRAADLIDRMVAEKIIGPPGPGGKREIFALNRHEPAQEDLSVQRR